MLNQIQGKVLTSTNHLGIQDLLVVLYDIDASSVQPTNRPIDPTHGFNFGTTFNPTVSATSRDGTTFTTRNTDFTRYLMELVRENDSRSNPALFNLLRALGANSNTGGPGVTDDVSAQPVETQTSFPENITLEQAFRSNARAWIDFPGDRLGSVLTERNGSFSLQYDDEAFRVSGSESRPDLVLFVLGPDHSQGVGVIDRLLHYAYIPRENSGRVESYIIHIDHSKLIEKHAPAVPPFVLPDPSIVASRLHENRDVRIRRRNLFSNSFKWLSPPGLATHDRFVPHGNPVVDTTVQIAIEGGLTLIIEADVKPAIAYLSAEHFTALGVSAPAADSPITLADIDSCDVLALKGIGVELTRIRELLNEYRARKRVDQIETDATTNLPSSPIAPVQPAPVTPDISYLQGKVVGQVADYPSIPTLPPRPELSLVEELQALKVHINDLELSSGPANVTAFRDFHSLQLAFEDIWTAAFDDALTSDIKELYEQTVALDDDYGVEFPNIDGTEDANQLLRYLHEVTDVAGEVEEQLEIVPELMAGSYPQLTQIEWNRTSNPQQAEFIKLTTIAILRINAPGSDAEREALDALYQRFIRDGALQSHPLSRISRFVADINDKLNEPYSFKYFAPNSVNYGILTSYRQEWRPQSYQVGRLVSTIPLAPGESRKLKINHQIKRSRAEKEMRKALVENSYESSSTIRSELDVIAKLSTESNFRMSAEGTFNIGIGSISSTSEFARNQKAESSRQQKQYAEATRKASEKVRQEREVSVEVSEVFESAREETQEIHNPNNEVTVTYLLYELERRYQVTHRLDRVTPIIMIALEMPSPHEITDGWILEHAWILRRVLLDDSFEAAISVIEKGRLSDAVDIEVKKSIYEKEKNLVDQIEGDLDAVLVDRRDIRESIIGFTKQKADRAAGERSTADEVGDFFLTGGFSALFGGGDGPDQGELIQAQIEAAKSRLKFVDEAAEEMGARLRAVRRAVREAADAYTNALKRQAQTDTLVRQFQLHLRQNIFHYMHAIWESKHPDELLFQLVDQEVPFIESATRTCEIRVATDAEAPAEIPGITKVGQAYAIECSGPVPPSPTGTISRKRFGSIARVDQLLGFKGNYAIFPLKDCTHITDYMMQEFVDDYIGIRDPATETGLSSPELLEYATESWSDLTAPQKAALKSLIIDQLSSPNKDTETIILPTGQLYMEALKGEQALLEDFKLAHRGMDVLKAQEEVRGERLENLRRAMRLVGDERDLNDPDVDKNIVVEGKGGFNINE